MVTLPSPGLFKAYQKRKWCYLIPSFSLGFEMNVHSAMVRPPGRQMFTCPQALDEDVAAHPLLTFSLRRGHLLWCRASRSHLFSFSHYRQVLKRAFLSQSFLSCLSHDGINQSLLLEE